MLWSLLREFHCMLTKCLRKKRTSNLPLCISTINLVNNKNLGFFFMELFNSKEDSKSMNHIQPHTFNEFILWTTVIWNTLFTSILDFQLYSIDGLLLFSFTADDIITFVNQFYVKNTFYSGGNQNPHFV